MAVTRCRPGYGFVLGVLLAAGAATPAGAQTVSGEVDVSSGVSTENVRSAAVQARLFGASRTDWRFFVEGSWGDGWGQESDAFTAAYPYDGSLHFMETYAERMFHPGGGLLGIRGGRYRSPFGIYSRSDHGYIGFTRAPLIRYGEDFALSNSALEAGGDLLAGTSRLFGEVSIGAPDDQGELKRRREISVVARAQGYYKSLIVGVSRMDTGRDKALGYASGRARWNGVDARWMKGGVLLRGEWIWGAPFTGVATEGAYVDVIVHRLGMGPFTAVARVEKLDYDAGPFSFYYKRVTGGARVHLADFLSAQVNLLHQPAGLSANRTTALDVGITATLRR